MTFAVRFPTRHTDSFSVTGFVHADVRLLAAKSLPAVPESTRELPVRQYGW